MAEAASIATEIIQSAIMAIVSRGALNACGSAVVNFLIFISMNSTFSSNEKNHFAVCAWLKHEYSPRAVEHICSTNNDIVLNQWLN